MDSFMDNKVNLEDLPELDSEELRNIQWVQDLHSTTSSTLSKAVNYWCHRVKSVTGTDAIQSEEWRSVFNQTINDTLCGLIGEVDQIHAGLSTSIQEHLMKLQKLCDELHQPVPQNLGDQKLCLYDEQKQLVQLINSYQTQVETKRQEVENLNKLQTEYCKYLGETPRDKLTYPPLPTADKIDEFKAHIDNLEALKFERIEMYIQHKEKIHQYVNDIQYSPNSDFERQVLNTDFLIPITNTTLAKLKLFEECLRDIKANTDEEIAQLRNQIEDYWKLLEVDLKHQDEFRSSNHGNSLVTLEALKVELNRCMEVKRANIKLFVEKLRVELEVLWMKCHRTELEKSNFKYFYEECFTEDLLELHELEAEKWKLYYQENKDILTALDQYQEMWTRVIELDEKSTDTDRLKNRGGKLLQEEKERKTIHKKISILTERILRLSEEYEAKNQVNFLSYGKTTEEFIRFMEDQRENKRQERNDAKKMRTATPTPNRSTRPPLGSTSALCNKQTSRSTTKRRLITTPRTENPKRVREEPQRLVGSESKLKPGPSTLPVPHGLGVRRRLLATQSERRVKRGASKNDNSGSPALSKIQLTVTALVQKKRTSRGSTGRRSSGSSKKISRRKLSIGTSRETTYTLFETRQQYTFDPERAQNICNMTLGDDSEGRSIE